MTITTEIDEDYFWDYWTADTVAGQSEYALPSDLKKVLGVSVKRLSTDTEYWKLKESRLSNYPRDILAYVQKNPVNDPFFIIAENSVFVYPAPTESVTGGIRIYGVKQFTDLTSTSTSAQILIPETHHQIISFGLAKYIYQIRQLFDKAQIQEQMYEHAKADMVVELGDRVMSPVEGQLPNTYLLS